MNDTHDTTDIQCDLRDQNSYSTKQGIEELQADRGD